MAKYSNGPDYDQHDEKVFRENLGTFGTGTKPGGNQLQELQAKVRQGVKHVELNLYGSGKGQFGQLDTPDKYGLEQRRTIMQLAKLNNQSLSVHGSFDLTSFSGITRNGFDEAERWKIMKEVDETVKFAAETAKGGAIVMHVHESQLPTPPSEINLPKKYLDWLENHKDPKMREEYKRLKEQYLSSSPLNRQFFEKPEMIEEIKSQYRNLDEEDKKEFYNKYSREIETEKAKGKEEWQIYYEKQKVDKMKLSPDMSPLIVVGDKIEQVDRRQELIDINVFKDGGKNLSDNDKKVLEILGIDHKDFRVEDFQKANAIFTNGLPSEYKNKIDEEQFYNLKKKLIVSYEKELKNSKNMQSQADSNFFKKMNEISVDLYSMQKESLQNKYKMFKSELERIKLLEDENRILLKKMEAQDDSSELGRRNIALIKNQMNEKVKLIEQLKYNYIGQERYHELSKYDETVAEINKKISEAKDKKFNVRSLTDEVFNKNTSSIAHLGIKALSYQLDLKNKSKDAEKKVAQYEKEIDELEKRYVDASYKNDLAEMEKLNNEIGQKRLEYRKWVGMKDYSDIDVKEKPLYIAPENMIVGYGYMTNLEEFKAVIRESWREFAEKIMSNDDFYKKIREDYERDVLEGKRKITKEDAYKIAKNHIGGTFDNAHASVWLKYFKKEVDPKTGKLEDEETRLERFNKWMNEQAEEMAKEGIIKHVHLNDSQGKDDDHNMLGTGVLDIHDLRHRLRKAGIKESFIVEAGGRGVASNLQVTNAFDVFNPSLGIEKDMPVASVNSGVSDWISTTRDYQRRPQYSSYGMGYSTFRHQPPQQGQQKGEWSGTSFF